ncbi:hypothetical protein IEQ34_017653 [Dendrobium chrysotoxum]|uniref:Uncharacterized protein n=1 Tax=Dendrobium chrysotoxum TaxID=161865 RepID=A0AAV7FUL3_DENCH|nr:hypothetical protein IEQ34_017653 [Dendrobium chrysotoxum]
MLNWDKLLPDTYFTVITCHDYVGIKIQGSEITGSRLDASIDNSNFIDSIISIDMHHTHCESNEDTKIPRCRSPFDTKFPGSNFRSPKHHAPLSPADHYSLLKLNADVIHPIELGITLSDGGTSTATWLFELHDIDLRCHPHAPGFRGFCLMRASSAASSRPHGMNPVFKDGSAFSPVTLRQHLYRTPGQEDGNRTGDEKEKIVKKMLSNLDDQSAAARGRRRAFSGCYEGEKRRISDTLASYSVKWQKGRLGAANKLNKVDESCDLHDWRER